MVLARISPEDAVEDGPMFGLRRRFRLSCPSRVVVGAIELTELGLIEDRLIGGDVVLVRGVGFWRAERASNRLARNRRIRSACHARTLRRVRV